MEIVNDLLVSDEEFQVQVEETRVTSRRCFRKPTMLAIYQTGRS
jgi:hypothetical protein